jgi:urease alpha subunit
VEVLEMAGDAQKMGQICDVLYRHWQVKNAAKTKGPPAQSVPSNGNGNRSKRLPRN